MERGKMTEALLAALFVMFLCWPGWAEPVSRTYAFIPDQSTVVQTGGWAGIYETHTIERGFFVLTVDLDANTASFDLVDANLSESIYLPTQSLGELFEMTELVSTEVNETVIEFEDTNPPLGGVDINITVAFESDHVLMTGERNEPWVDGFGYDLDAVAWKWADVEIVPEKPTCSDVVAITLSGEWPDSCIPLDSNVAVIGKDVYFDAIVEVDQNTVCTQVPTPWELAESVGPLTAGTYTVYARIVGYGGIPETYMWMMEFTVGGLTYYVDGVNGSDDNDGLSLETAFATIQKGVDEANYPDTVLVYPAVYTDPVDFYGKAITVQGAATEAGPPIVETPMDYAFSFYSDEEPNSVLRNFVVRNSYLAALLIGASPTISNLVIVDNRFGIEAYAGSEPDISSCIFYNNTNGDIFGCQAKYSWMWEGGDLVTEGLISHWKLDEGAGTTAYDSAGDNDGTLVNGPAWTTGVLNGALSFDDLDDYVDVGDRDALDFGQEDSFSISAWVKTAADGPVVYKRRCTGAGGYYYEGYQVKLISENVFFALEDITGSGASVWGAGVVTNNQWRHIAAVRDAAANELYLYLDGNSDAAPVGDPTTETLATARSLEIGRSDSTVSPGLSYYGGKIDDVRIYDRALSADEIRQLSQSEEGPMFADAAGGDYHLLSERGRYWPEHNVWVLDDVTSPCVDGGDPNDNPGDERMPNGGRINMGVYGGTPYASMSEWAMTGDVSKDGIVNFKDIAIVAAQWLDKFGWAE